MYRRGRYMRGLGETQALAFPFVEDGGMLPAGPGTTVNVVACAPDVCLDWRFPWVGRRTENPAGDPPCVCQPVFAVPSPFGAVISAALGLAIGFKLFRGVTG